MTEYAGSGERSLELLWRTSAQPTRGPKPKLDLDQIVKVAIELADEEGFAPLSMRKVAERLGVGTMSLYTYVPGKAELLDLMIDATAALPSAPADGTWRERLERIAREGWDRFHRHPWLLEITMVRPVLGPNVTARYDHELQAIDGIGLTDVEMDAVVTVIAGHVEGAARRALEAALAEQRTGHERSGMVGGARANSRALDRARSPSRSRAGWAGCGRGAQRRLRALSTPFGLGYNEFSTGIEVARRDRASDDSGQI